MQHRVADSSGQLTRRAISPAAFTAAGEIVRG